MVGAVKQVVSGSQDRVTNSYLIRRSKEWSRGSFNTLYALLFKI
jgi:hypothetical protein